MNNDLKQKLDTTLKHYSIDVKYWNPQISETFLMLGKRLFLQKHLTDMTEEQHERMREIDQRVLELASVDYELQEDEDDSDVRTLGFVADIINGIEIPPKKEPIRLGDEQSDDSLESDMESFSDIQSRLGRTVYRKQLPDKTREQLKNLFKDS